jgi:hypothetical protein
VDDVVVAHCGKIARRDPHREKAAGRGLKQPVRGFYAKQPQTEWHQ